MSLRSKNALVSLVGLALGYGWYFGVLLARQAKFLKLHHGAA